jgi:hypothetical protein
MRWWRNKLSYNILTALSILIQRIGLVGVYIRYYNTKQNKYLSYVTPPSITSYLT